MDLKTLIPQVPTDVPELELNKTPGIYVVTLQLWLKMLGYDCGKVDGQFKDKVEKQVERFNQDHPKGVADAKKVDFKVWKTMDGLLRDKLPPNPETLERLPFPERKDYPTNEDYAHAVRVGLENFGFSVKTKQEVFYVKIDPETGIGLIKNTAVGNYKIELIDKEIKEQIMPAYNGDSGSLEIQLFYEDEILTKKNAKLTSETPNPESLRKTIRLFKALVRNIDVLEEKHGKELKISVIIGDLSSDNPNFYKEAWDTFSITWGQFYGAPWMGIMIDPTDKDNLTINPGEFNWGRYETIKLLINWGKEYISKNDYGKLQNKLYKPIVIKHIANVSGTRVKSEAFNYNAKFQQTGSGALLQLPIENSLNNKFYGTRQQGHSEKVMQYILNSFLELSPARAKIRSHYKLLSTAYRNKLTAQSKKILTWSKVSLDEGRVVLISSKNYEQSPFLGKKRGIIIVTQASKMKPYIDYIKPNSSESNYRGISVKKADWELKTGDWIKIISVERQVYYPTGKPEGSKRYEVVRGFKIAGLDDREDPLRHPYKAHNNKFYYFWIIYEDMEMVQVVNSNITTALIDKKLPTTFTKPSNWRTLTKWRMYLGLWRNSDNDFSVLFSPRTPRSGKDNHFGTLSGFIIEGEYEGTLWFDNIDAVNDGRLILADSNLGIKEAKLNWRVNEIDATIEYPLELQIEGKKFNLKKAEKTPNYKQLSGVSILHDQDFLTGSKQHNIKAVKTAWQLGADGIKVSIDKTTDLNALFTSINASDLSYIYLDLKTNLATFTAIKETISNDLKNFGNRIFTIANKNSITIIAKDDSATLLENRLTWGFPWIDPENAHKQYKEFKDQDNLPSVISINIEDISDIDLKGGEKTIRESEHILLYGIVNSKDDFIEVIKEVKRMKRKGSHGEFGIVTSVPHKIAYWLATNNID